jgi:hypothetical protein
MPALPDGDIAPSHSLIPQLSPLPVPSRPLSSTSRISLPSDGSTLLNTRRTECLNDQYGASLGFLFPPTLDHNLSFGAQSYKNGDQQSHTVSSEVTEHVAPWRIVTRPYPAIESTLSGALGDGAKYFMVPPFLELCAEYNDSSPMTNIQTQWAYTPVSTEPTSAVSITSISTNSPWDLERAPQPEMLHEQEDLNLYWNHDLIQPPSSSFMPLADTFWQSPELMSTAGLSPVTSSTNQYQASTLRTMPPSLPPVPPIPPLRRPRQASPRRHTAPISAIARSSSSSSSQGPKLELIDIRTQLPAASFDRARFHLPAPGPCDLRHSLLAPPARPLGERRVMSQTMGIGMGTGSGMASYALPSTLPVSRRQPKKSLGQPSMSTPISRPQLLPVGTSGDVSDRRQAEAEFIRQDLQRRGEVETCALCSLRLPDVAALDEHYVWHSTLLTTPSPDSLRNIVASFHIEGACLYFSLHPYGQ